MSTKYINGSYPGGYALDTKVSRLTIGPSAHIDGAGVSGARVSPVRVTNQGGIDADVTHDGIRLVGGGIVTNSGAGVISGYHGVDISGGTGRIVNSSGTIASATKVVGQISTRYASVVLEAGGSVTNASAGVIANGVDISGAAGTITNDGVIGGVYFFQNGPAGQFTLASGPSVTLRAGGQVSNGASNARALISGGLEISGGSGALVNAGTITGYSTMRGGTDTFDSVGPSVILADGGSVTNQSTGNLLNGVSIAGAGTVSNLGQIGAGAQGSGAYGSYLSRNDSIDLDQGKVTNGNAQDTTASIGNGLTGVQFAKGPGRVANFGSIIGKEDEVSTAIDRFSAGAKLFHGGVVVNGTNADRTASIMGHDSGVFVTGGTGAITNFGAITETEPVDSDDIFDGDWGIFLGAGGSVKNGSHLDSSAQIFGAIGVSLYGTGTITNYGAIIGNPAGAGEDGLSVFAVDLHSASETLIEEGSGKLTGAVAGGGGTLLLDNNAGDGTLTGLGSTITGFGDIRVAAGANWQLTGTNTVIATASFRDYGKVEVGQGGTLSLHSGIKGVGALALYAGSAAEIDGAVSTTETVRFSGNNATLTLDTPGSFGGVVSNLAGRGSDRLKLEGFGAGTSLGFKPNGSDSGGTLTVTNGSDHARIILLGQYVAAGFHETTSASETTITYVEPAQTPVLAPHVWT